MIIRNAFLLVVVLAGLLPFSTVAEGRQPIVKVVQNGESSAKPEACRGIIVGPNVTAFIRLKDLGEH